MKRYLENEIDKSKLTRFNSPLEGENYLKKIGAVPFNEDGIKKYKFHGLVFYVDREYRCLYESEPLTTEVCELLKLAGFESYFGHYHLIDSLEELAYLCGIVESFNSKISNPREYMERVVRDAKKLTLMECREMIDEYRFKESFYSDFDKASIPFFDDDFDYDKFIDECIFQTTGPYIKNGRKSIKFEWHKIGDNTVYAFKLYGFSEEYTIMIDKPCKPNHTQIYHFVGEEGERIMYFPLENISEDSLVLYINASGSRFISGEIEREATNIDFDYFNKLQYYFCATKTDNKKKVL